MIRGNTRSESAGGMVCRTVKKPNGSPDSSVVGPSGKASGGSHTKNFLECIKSRNRPNSDVEIGRLSTMLCHLGNISYKTGRAIRFDAQTETCVGDAEANRLLGRTYRAPFVVPKTV